MVVVASPIGPRRALLQRVLLVRSNGPACIPTFPRKQGKGQNRMRSALGRAAEVGGRRSEVGGRESGVGSRESGVGSRESEVSGHNDR